MTSEKPSFRANVAKAALGDVKRLTPDQSERVLAALGGDARARIREAGLLSFIEPEALLALTRALETGLGPTGAHEFWKRHLVGALSRPLLAPLRAGAIALYGRSPRALLRRAPHAWRLITRCCGAIALEERSENAVALELTGLHPVLCTEPSLLRFLSGCAEGAVTYFGRKGTAVVRDDLSNGRATIDVRWE